MSICTPAGRDGTISSKSLISFSDKSEGILSAINVS